MNALLDRPLPNVADKAALKTIAATVIEYCPGLSDTARDVARDLLKKQGLPDLDPDHVFFHRFKAAQSSTKSFTGWEHVREKPYETLTLTQLVIHRFRATDQDNADLLDLYGGFYSAGPNHDTFNETNEVRLHGNDVLKAFWSLDFSTLYNDRLASFWNTHADDFRTLTKCNFLSSAISALDNGQLTGEDYQQIVDTVIGPFNWPVTLQMLRSSHSVSGNVRTVDIAGHTATRLLRFVMPSGRQIIYLPGEVTAFQVLETEADMHWWMLQRMNDATQRRTFLSHFSLNDCHQIEQNITDLMNRLVSDWGRTNHRMINQTNTAVSNDAFTWLRDSTRHTMFAEAELSLTSNADLRKKLWIGYLSAGLRVFGPMAAIGWPVALPLICAGIAKMGLNIDQAYNGKTVNERHAGLIAINWGIIETLFNTLALYGTGPISDVGAEVDAAEAAEMAEYSESLSPSEPPASVEDPAAIVPDDPEFTPPGIDQRPPFASDIARPPSIPSKYLCNEMLDGLVPETSLGKFRGIYRLQGDYPYAILLDEDPYYVRYFAETEERGYWAIIDPDRPNQFVSSLPVRLNAAGQWERMRPLRLKGGGQCFGKECAPEGIELDNLQPAPLEAQAPPQGSPVRLLTTSYDAPSALKSSLKTWALDLPEDFAQWAPNAGEGAQAEQNMFARHFQRSREALISASRTFYRNLPWSNLPPRPPIPDISQAMDIGELIDRIFANARGLVVGETLNRITSMRLLIENMPALARHVKTIYVRRLLNDFAQSELNDYFGTGIMSDDLENYLIGLGTDPAGQFDEFNLVRAAQQNGIRIQALDCAASYKSPIPHSAIEEQMIANLLTHEIHFMDRTLNNPARWVVLTLPENTNTFRGLAGVSETEGGIGLRIEEVNPGEETGVDIDPGIEVDRGPFANADLMRGTEETLYADLRLRMEAPPVTWNEVKLRKLLYRQAMYIFEKNGEAYTLVHRNRLGQLIRTQVQQLADDHFTIHRQQWPSMNDVPFASLEELAQGLNKMGMSMQSRFPA
ncbi:toxin [Pseudomonas syringae]|nr:toxin [Pseudomonas syringae]MCF5068320.1 toxin [Pseudomonas syringae]